MNILKRLGKIVVVVCWFLPCLILLSIIWMPIDVICYILGFGTPVFATFDNVVNELFTFLEEELS